MGMFSAYVMVIFFLQGKAEILNKNVSEPHHFDVAPSPETAEMAVKSQICLNSQLNACNFASVPQFFCSFPPVKLFAM
jgi:hypothetical protein